MVWPTEITPLLLVAGVATLVIAFLLTPGRGFGRTATLQFGSVAFFWIGYHLSPLSSYLTGEIWETYLLAPDWIDEGLLFSLLCCWACIIGYRLRNGNSRRTANLRFPAISFPRVAPSHVVVLAVVCVISFVTIVGGPEEVWYASYVRGEGQFDERDMLGKALHMLRVVNTALAIMTAMMGSLAIVQKGGGVASKLSGWAAVLVSSLHVLHKLSRASGFAFVILGLLNLMVRGRRKMGFTIGCGVLAIVMGLIGLYGRSKHPVGLGGYLDAIAHFDELGIGGGDGTERVRNPIDAMAAWTRRADTRRDEPSGTVDLMLTWGLNLHPLPSELLPMPSVGVPLRLVMGRGDSVGLTTPAFGELYYAFGRWGALWLLGVGYLFAFFERLPKTLPGGLGLACWGLALTSLPIGLHNGGRAMTRPLFYGIVLYWVGRWWSGWRSLRSTAASRSPGTASRLTHAPRRSATGIL